MKKARTHLQAGSISRALGLALAAALTGCGSGGDDNNGPQTVSGTISGVAATGDAISGGLVTLKCAGGLSAVTTATHVDGSFSFSADKVTLPCLAQVSYTDAGGNPQTLHSYVSATGTTNITPLSDLLLATLLNTPSLAPAFASFHNTPLRTFSAAEQAAVIVLLSERLQELGITLPEGIDPLHGVLVARTATQEGNALDQLLDDLNLAMQTEGVSQFQLGLIVTLGMPLETAVNFLPAGAEPSPEEQLQFTQGLSAYNMIGTHRGTLQDSSTACAFSVDENGHLGLNFTAPNSPSSLLANNRPTADGLTISLNPEVTGPGIRYIDRQQPNSHTWNILAFSPPDIGNFFQLTGANGVRSVTLRYITRTSGSGNPGDPVRHYMHRELGITLPTTSVAQNGSANCITPELEFIPIAT